MRLMIASDIHGSSYYLKKLLEQYKNEQPDKLLLLGDLLYHGPRNDLPKGYDPQEIIGLLNNMKEEILCVRGNCDTEVDQMVLPFPIMADYGLLSIEGKTLYATHGHVFHPDHLPPMQEGDALLYGHTHLLRAERVMAEGIGQITVLNPGSVSIPKGGNPATYGILEKGVFSILTFEGDVVAQIGL